MFHAFPLVLALAVPACKKDEKPEANDATKTAATEDKADSKPEAKAEGDAKGTNPEVSGGAATTADSMSAVGAMTRGAVLAHVMLPNPAALLDKLKKQAAPSSASMFLDVNSLKDLAALGLGARAEVARNVELDKPLACVLVESTASPVPLACVVGYKGGADKLVEHMGTDGKQADAGGAKAHFLIDTQHLYIDALGDRVVVGTDPDTVAKAKPYLEKNIVGRADKNISDVEVVGYVSALMQRYEKELDPVLKSMAEPTGMSDETPVQKALMDYAVGGNKDAVQRFRDMEQVTFAFGFHADGFTARWAVFPVAGSAFETELKAVSAGPVDLGFVEKLPDHSVLLSGVRFDGKLGENASFKALREAIVAEYAKELGKDAAAVNAAIEAFVAEQTSLYGTDLAVALTYEPGTLGGVLLEVPLRDGKSGREQWKAWTETFAAVDVLGPEASKKVTWSFKADATTIGGTPIDRWTIELTADAVTELAKESPEKIDALKKKWDPQAITIDRAEVDGRVLFVVTPKEGDKYMQAAIDAVQGKNALADDSGYKAVAAKASAVSSFVAVDVKQGADFLRSLLPPEEGAKIPASFGNDLSDAFFTTSYGRAGTQTGEFTISQTLIDQIRALSN